MSNKIFYFAALHASFFASRLETTIVQAPGIKKGIANKRNAIFIIT